MKRLILPALAILALASCGKGPATPDTPGCLAGTVLDTLNGLPLSGAKVVAGSIDSTATDAEGRFLLSLTQGRYTVQVSKDGYYGVAANVPVLSRDTIRVTIHTRLRAWLPGTAMDPGEERHNFASVLRGGLLYAIGGRQTSGASFTHLSTSVSFSPASGSWGSGTVASLSPGREQASCVAVGDTLFIFGGLSGSSVLASVEKHFASWIPAATPMPAGARGMAAFAVGDSIFVFGGFTGGDTATSLVRVYKPSADTAGGTPWKTASPMPAPLGGMSCASIGGTIYFFGGGNHGIASPQVFSYNPAGDAWTSRANMPAERAYAACAAVGNDIYVFGGLAGTTVCNSTYRYNPAANTWTVMEPMPLARYGAGAVAHNNRIHVFGGFDGTNSLGVNEIYNPAADVK